MSHEVDVHAYLERRADELVDAIHGGTLDTRAGAAFMKGAVRALETTGHLDRTRGARILEDFGQRMEEEGLAERITLGIGVPGPAVTETEGGARPSSPPAPATDVETVVAVQRVVDVPPPHRLVLLSLVCWTTHFDLDWAWITPDIETRDRSVDVSAHPPSLLPWRVDAWDDAGTRFQASGGSGSLTRVRTTMKPAIPAVATQLTTTLRSLQTHDEVSQITLDLTQGQSGPQRFTG